MRIESERLVTDLKTVARDAESLVKATAGEVGEKAREARSRLMTALESAKESAEVLQEKAIAGAKATDQAIRKHPYPALGIAFGVGVLIGILAARVGRDRGPNPAGRLRARARRPPPLDGETGRRLRARPVPGSGGRTLVRPAYFLLPYSPEPCQRPGDELPGYQ